MESILTYPNFNEVFEILIDATDRQLDEDISQNGKPLAFYSRKLSNVQRNHSTTEQERLRSIIKTLNEFRNILLGQRIKVFTDHKK